MTDAARRALMGDPHGILTTPDLSYEDLLAEKDNPWLWNERGGLRRAAVHAHAHLEMTGECIRNKFGPKCTVPAEGLGLTPGLLAAEHQRRMAEEA